MKAAGHPTVAVLCGGVGAARFLLGLQQVVPAAAITGIVNTGDDTVLHGLHISPDLDTIIYTLAAAIDPGRGWGLAGETWAAMGALARYTEVRPDTSTAASTWFNLGDRDLATHLYRTARLNEGATLTTITHEIGAAWSIGPTIIPMSDDRLSTRLTLTSGEEVSFQDYFVRLQHGVPVTQIRFDGDAALSDAAALALERADVIIIAPSNPLVSIAPIRYLAGVDGILSARRDRVVAISPIVGGAALKGPADRLLNELGSTATVGGMADQYREVAATLIIDTVDQAAADGVTGHGMHPVVTDTVMARPDISAALATTAIRAAGFEI